VPGFFGSSKEEQKRRVRRGVSGGKGILSRAIMFARMNEREESDKKQQLRPNLKVKFLYKAQ